MPIVQWFDDGDGTFAGLDGIPTAPSAAARGASAARGAGASRGALARSAPPRPATVGARTPARVGVVMMSRQDAPRGAPGATSRSVRDAVRSVRALAARQGGRLAEPRAAVVATGGHGSVVASARRGPPPSLATVILPRAAVQRAPIAAIAARSVPRLPGSVAVAMSGLGAWDSFPDPASSTGVSGCSIFERVKMTNAGWTASEKTTFCKLRAGGMSYSRAAGEVGHAWPPQPRKKKTAPPATGGGAPRPAPPRPPAPAPAPAPSPTTASGGGDAGGGGSSWPWIAGGAVVGVGAIALVMSRRKGARRA